MLIQEFLTAAAGKHFELSPKERWWFFWGREVLVFGFFGVVIRRKQNQ